ncbi:MAG: DnaJ domain-containing protein [Alphaproteobacteria bacterium]|nr:DnaJ domain-containing protein [Alphaproteobacteria bacterium]
MIKKCDFPNCSKAGTCRAPKARDLKEYYWFCKEHAAEYNKNWNYYAGMTTDEIEEDWEKETFGISDNERKAKEKANADYVAFLQNFLTGRDNFDRSAGSRARRQSGASQAVSSALQTFDLPPTASWREVQTRYRALAKKFHPDTAKNKKSAAAEFARISTAYGELKKYYSPPSGGCRRTGGGEGG